MNKLNNLLISKQISEQTNIINQPYSYLIKQKEDEIKSFILKIKTSKTKSKFELKKINDQLIHLRQLAVSKNGFLYNSLRKELYSLYFTYYNQYNSYYNLISNDKEIGFKSVSMSNSDSYQKDISTIEFDCRRLIVNRVEDGILTENEKKQIKTITKNALTSIIMNHSSIKYYQGLHEISYYIGLIYFNDKDSRTVEMNINSNNPSYDNYIQMLLYIITNKLHDFCFSYNNSQFDIFKINFAFELIFKETSSFSYSRLKKICSSSNSQVELKEVFSLIVIPLCLTWFTQSIENVNVMFRIFDYLIVSGPMTIYFLVSVFLDEYIKKIDYHEDKDGRLIINNTHVNDIDIFVLFKLELIINDISYTKINDFVFKCEEKIQNFSFESLKNLFLPKSPIRYICICHNNNDCYKLIGDICVNEIKSESDENYKLNSRFKNKKNNVFYIFSFILLVFIVITFNDFKFYCFD